ncbi:MAG: aspartate aminotransferase family protein [Phycisphaerales bacterium]
MSFDLQRLLAAHRGKNHELLAEHVNPQLARVLRTIGYDRFYVRAEGASLWDEQGREYLDFLGGYAVCNVGRNHPVVRKALEDALAADLPSMVQFDAPLLAGLLARELSRRMPVPLERVYFTNSGTEGIEAAMKIARCATGRPGVLYADKAFHGLTYGSLSLNGCESFRGGFAPFLEGCRQVRFGDLGDLERALAAGDVACFVVEPVQGKGVNIAPPGYLAEASRLCHRHGALLVVDEVQTGVGRTGTFLAIEQHPGCEPDIVVMAKALSGGYVPVGAVLVRTAVWERVFSSMDRAIVHSSTFHMGALAMAAGLAVLDVYDTQRLGERSRRMGQLLLEGLERLRGPYEFVAQVRGQGLMVAVEFGQPRSLALRAAWNAIHAMSDDLFAQAAVIPLFEDHRILCQVAGHGQPTVKLTPPLVVDEAQIQRFLVAFEAVLKGMHRLPGPVYDILVRLGKNSLTRRSYEEAVAASAVATA